MNASGQRGLWMIAILAFLGAIGYVALRPPSQAPADRASSISITAPVVPAPVTPANPFIQSAPVHSARNPSGDWTMEGLNPGAYIHTFQRVFPHTTLWYTGAAHSFLVATPYPLTRDQILALDAQLKQSAAGADLGDSQLLAADLMMHEEEVAAFAANGRVVRDDRAFFHSGYGSRTHPGGARTVCARSGARCRALT